MPEKLRAAVIGTGMGRYHMEGYANNPNCDLVAVCDLNEPEAKQMAETYGATEVYTDWEKMLTHQFDIVSVAVPNYLHAPISIAALESGANVLCEKPMATRFEDAERMVATAAKTGRYLQINMSMRYYPASRRVRQLTEQGAMGEVYMANARLIRRKGMPRLDFDSSGTMGRGEWFVRSHLAGGGALMDIGVHAFDLMWWTMGSPKPVSVRATRFAALRSGEIQERSISSDVDQHAAAFVSFENGASAFFEVCWDSNQPNSWDLHLFGDQMGATLGETAVLHKRVAGEVSDVEVETIEELNVSSYDSMVAAVLDPKAPRISEGKGCLEVARVLEAVRLSADEGEEVVLD